MISILKQISIFIENKPGKIGKISEVLHDIGVRIEAMMIEDSGEFGVVKLILNDYNRGKEELARNGFTVSEIDVISIRKEHAGSDDIMLVAKKLKESNINVQYAYGFTSKETLIVLRTNDQTKTLEVLKTMHE
jgi:hypothetical protein